MCHVCREGDELSRCISVYELNLFGRCMKSMQLGGNRRDGGVGIVGGLEMPGFASVCEVLIATRIFVEEVVILCCLS